MKKLLSIVMCMSVLLSVGLAGVAEETARDAFISQRRPEPEDGC